MVKTRSYRQTDSTVVGELFDQFVDYHRQFGVHFIKVEHSKELFIEYIVGHVSDTNFRCIVAESGQEIVGYCIARVEEKPPVYPEPRYGYIDNICVDKKYHFQGIGSKLLAGAEEWFKEQGIKRVECFQAVDNNKAREFWARKGYDTYMEQRSKIL